MKDLGFGQGALQRSEWLSLAGRCEEAGFARIKDYFSETKSPAWSSNGALSQADLFLRLGSQLRRAAAMRFADAETAET